MIKGVTSYAHQHGDWSFYWEPGGLGTAWARTGSALPPAAVFRNRCHQPRPVPSVERTGH